MAFEYEVDSDLDWGNEIAEVSEADDLDSDYGEVFSEEDFKALGISPGDPTGAKPGSEAKVKMLAARYAAGLPLWHDSDCYDHGPADRRSEA